MLPFQIFPLPNPFRYIFSFVSSNIFIYLFFLLQFSQPTFICPQVSNGPLTGSRKRPSEGNYEKEKDVCIQLFDQWSEADQVEFVEHLISRMCHYQHGHINTYLKPMLQRDFITALPGNTHRVLILKMSFLMEGASITVKI